MPRPPIEVADVIRAAGETFFERSPKWFTWLHLKVLNAILRCRTTALGGHVDTCSGCGHQAISFNSCRNRHCPRCQANARDRWLQAREKELLPTRYVHVVFTLPRQLSPLALQNKREVYALLFQASAETLLQVAGDPKRLGAEIGFFSVLHTWNQKLQHHPHVHCVVPAGGLALDHSSWIDSQQRFFLPVEVLGEVFRESLWMALKHCMRSTDSVSMEPSPHFRIEGVCGLASSPVPHEMGGLRKTPVRRCATRASLPRPVHPSDSDFKPSTRCTRRWRGHVSLARLRSQKQKASDDSAGRRVSAPISAARATAGIRPHPPLRVSGPSLSWLLAPTLLTTLGRFRPSFRRNQASRNSCHAATTAVDLSAMRRTNGPPRTAQPY